MGYSREAKIIYIKHNGKWRLCIDYRKVNDMTEKDSYSVPYIDEIFDSLGGAKIFTTLEITPGVTVYDSIVSDGVILENPKDYTVSYSNNIWGFFLC